MTPGPAGEYVPADIAYGARLYDAQCTTCHGANGDGVGGVDLRSGRFRNGTTDQDLTRIVTTGIPGTGMLGFKLDTAELTGIIAFLRNMTSFDRGSVIERIREAALLTAPTSDKSGAIRAPAAPTRWQRAHCSRA